MDIRIDSIVMQQDAFEVRATFTEGTLSVTKVAILQGTKEKVEHWLQNEAERISESLKTVGEFKTLEKDYIYDKGVLTTKSVFEAVK